MRPNWPLQSGEPLITSVQSDILVRHSCATWISSVAMEILLFPLWCRLTGSHQLWTKWSTLSVCVCVCVCVSEWIWVPVSFIGWDALGADLMRVMLMHFFCSDISMRAPQSGEPEHQQSEACQHRHRHIYLSRTVIYQFLNVFFSANLCRIRSNEPTQIASAPKSLRNTSIWKQNLYSVCVTQRTRLRSNSSLIKNKLKCRKYGKSSSVLRRRNWQGLN